MNLYTDGEPLDSTEDCGLVTMPPDLQSDVQGLVVHRGTLYKREVVELVSEET